MIFLEDGFNGSSTHRVKRKTNGFANHCCNLSIWYYMVAPRIVKFTNSYPDIDVSIRIENKYTDLSQGEADVA